MSQLFCIECNCEVAVGKVSQSALEHGAYLCNSRRAD